MSTTLDPKRDGPVVAERPQPGAPRPYDFPTVTGGRLSNGLSVLIADLPGRPLISASIVVTGGAVEEPPGVAGATVLAARALTEGTERYEAIALVEAGERLGASLHADAGWDALTVGVDVPAARLEPALDLVAEVLLHPTFPESEVERLRDERLNDLLQVKADPRRRVDEAFVEHDLRARLALSPAVRRHARDRRAPRQRRAPARLRPDARPEPGDAGGRWRPRRTGRHGAWPSASSVRGARPRTAIAQRSRAIVDTRLHRRSRRSRHPPAGVGPDRDPDRSSRAAAPDRRLPCRLGHERDPRRALQLAPEHEAARGEGLHVRRRCRLRHAPRRRSVLGPSRRSTRRSRSRPIVDMLAELTRMRDNAGRRVRARRGA